MGQPAARRRDGAGVGAGGRGAGEQPVQLAGQRAAEGPDGVGSQRRCVFADGSSVVEEVTEWEPNRQYRVRLVEMGKMPVQEAHATLSVEPLDGEHSRLKMAMDYRMKYGPLGWVMGQTMMKSMMGGIFEGVLKGLKDNVLSRKSA